MHKFEELILCNFLIDYWVLCLAISHQLLVMMQHVIL